MRKACLFIILLFVSTLSVAQTSLWKISRGDKHLYLGGTIHMLSQSDYPLPQAFDKAYELSAAVVFETDIAGSASPEFQQHMMRKLTYQDGRTLKTVLRPATYQALSEHSAKTGLPLANLQTFRPGMLAITLTLMELQRLGMGGAGVDQFYSSKARIDGKSIKQFESLDEQLGFLINMGQGQEDELIMQTLDDIKQLASKMNEIKSAWRSGNSQQLAEITQKDLKDRFPGVFNSLIVERNNNWMPKLEAMLATAEVELVLVGVAHLVGDAGMIRQLREKGYKIEQW